MRAWKPLLQLLLFAGFLTVTGAARQSEKPIDIIVKPGEGAVLMVSITNHSRQEIWFTSCPDPYTIEPTDSSGHAVPPKHVATAVAQVMVCGGNILYTIKPGNTWNTRIELNQTFDLKAGSYTARIQWHFPWNVRKTSEGEEWDTLTVTSNTTTLTVN